MPHQKNIKTAHSVAPDARLAVREFHAAVSGPDLALVVFFCSSQYDLDVLADEINFLFADIPVIGCTTAGEIGPAGSLTHSISGASFPAGDCTAVVGRMDRLQAFNADAGQAFVGKLLGRLESITVGTTPGNRFALEMIDGLSNREETVVNVLQRALGNIPLVGGSAGDDLAFEHTQVFCDGEFHTDAAVLAIVETVYPLTLFKTQHFVGTHERMVVTAADASNRTIMELNGLPAAQEYARVVGVRLEDLTASIFSASPVVVRINGVDYVRSIQKTNPDGSLTFYCAIDRGLILRVAHGADFVGNLQHTFDDIHAKVGAPQLVIACDCIFRRLEMTDKHLTADTENVFQHNNVVGFSTYGEQFMGIHVNQTLTGLAIGYAAGEQHG
jgi:hypothetical protein